MKLQKITLTICLFTILTLHAEAQMATHSLGFSTNIGFRNYDAGNDRKESESYAFFKFDWAFRKNLSEKENSSFSLGTSLNAGGGIYEDMSGYTGFLYGGGLQLWGDHNHGMGAVENPGSNRGYHVGLGFGATYTGADGESIDDENGVSFGPMIRAGYRFGMYKARKDLYKPIGISVSYMHGLEEARWRTLGFHFMFDL
jgi:hypothetical protein